MYQAEVVVPWPWGSLGRTSFMSPEDLKIKGGSRKSGRSEKIKKISAILDRLAKQKGTVIASIALAYVMHTILYVLLVTRGRNIEHFRGNIEALKI